MTKVREVELYQKPLSKPGSRQIRSSGDRSDNINPTSAFVCGERLKKAVKNHPEKDRTGDYIILNKKKYNIDTMLFRIDLLSRENTVLSYKLYQLTGLEGLIKGMSSPKRNLEVAEGKVVKRKKPVKKDVD
jgi:hypothetical protein